jgi:hypothetical protein
MDVKIGENESWLRRWEFVKPRVAKDGKVKASIGWKEGTAGEI